MYLPLKLNYVCACRPISRVARLMLQLAPEVKLHGSSLLLLIVIFFNKLLCFIRRIVDVLISSFWLPLVYIIPSYLLKEELQWKEKWSINLI